MSKNQRPNLGKNVFGLLVSVVGLRPPLVLCPDPLAFVESVVVDSGVATRNPQLLSLGQWLGGCPCDVLASRITCDQHWRASA